MIRNRNVAPGAMIDPSKILGGLGAPLTRTAKYLYVDSNNGSDTLNGLSPQTAKGTIAGAIAAATDGAGDVIYVMPRHAETVTAAITVNKAGVSIIGLGYGGSRPSVTGNGTIDAINITSANVTIENIQFPAPGTDDQTADINVAAAGVVIRNTYHIGSTTSKNKTDIITVASGGDDVIIEGVRMYNTVVDCVSGISLEAAVARPIIRDCVIQGTFSTSCLMDEATATLALIQRNIFKNTKTTGTCFNFTNNSTGVMSFNHNSGRNTTIASNYVLGTGMDYFENRLVEEAALNGAILPAADTD